MIASNLDAISACLRKTDSSLMAVVKYDGTRIWISTPELRRGCEFLFMQQKSEQRLGAAALCRHYFRESPKPK
jgi:hypothetical protein